VLTDIFDLSALVAAVAGLLGVAWGIIQVDRSRTETATLRQRLEASEQEREALIRRHAEERAYIASVIEGFRESRAEGSAGTGEREELSE